MGVSLGPDAHLPWQGLIPEWTSTQNIDPLGHLRMMQCLQGCFNCLSKSTSCMHAHTVDVLCQAPCKWVHVLWVHAEKTRNHPMSFP